MSKLDILSFSDISLAQNDKGDSSTIDIDELYNEPLHYMSLPDVNLLTFPTHIPLAAGKIVGKVIDENANPIPSANIQMASKEGIRIRQMKSDCAVCSKQPIAVSNHVGSIIFNRSKKKLRNKCG